MTVDGDSAGDWRPMVRDLIHRTERELLTVLDGLAPELIDELPESGTDSIGWLLWHLTRSHDRNVSELQGKQQLWCSEGWHSHFGREADPADTGYHHTLAQVASFRSPARRGGR